MNIVFTTATQLAQMIRNQEVSAVEVLNAHLEQIEKYNHQINAIATLNRDKAIKRAIEADEALAKGENWGVLHDVPVTIKDLQNLINCLTNAGCDLSESHPSSSEWSEMLTSYGILSFFELFASTSSLKDLIRGLQFALKNQFLAQTQTSYKSSSISSQKTSQAFPPSLAKYKAILADRDRAMVKMDLFMEQWDAWICPVSLDAAFPHCNFAQPIEVDGVKIPYLVACGGYTMPLNFTGNPVVVIPMGQSRSGLPIGVQIVGKRWQDLDILAIANEIDQLASNFQQPSL